VKRETVAQSFVVIHNSRLETRGRNIKVVNVCPFAVILTMLFEGT
jgi:hypothetical protein